MSWAPSAAAQREAPQAIQRGQSVVFDFSLRGAGPPLAEPICGGALRVLLDAVPAKHAPAWTAAAKALAARERGVLLTEVHGTTPPAVTVRWLPEHALAAQTGFPEPAISRSVLRSETAVLMQGGGPAPALRQEVLVEPLLPRPQWLIAGGGHVGQTVARLTDFAGFEVAAFDDRVKFTRAELFPPGTRTWCGEISRQVARFPFAHDTCVVIVTRGHSHDAEALAACLRRPCADVGLIGSRRKVALMRREFLATGRATAAEFDRVDAPIGLDLGAVTVPEIAVSVVAQLIAVRRTGRAARMPREESACFAPWFWRRAVRGAWARRSSCCRSRASHDRPRRGRAPAQSRAGGVGGGGRGRGAPAGGARGPRG